MLKTKDLDYRPALQKLLVSDGKMYATDGYVVFEICDVKEDMNGKCFTLDTLIKWNALNTKSTDMLDMSLAEENKDSVPQIKNLIGDDFEPCSNLRFNVYKLKLCTDFLGVKNIRLESSKNNKYLYKVIPICEDEMDIITKALGSKAYIMGVK